MSAGTHLGVLALTVELLGVRPVVGSSVGFVASILVSYLLQHRWVFATGVAVGRSAPRFAVVTAIGFGLNATIMWVGPDVLGLPYLLPQAVAFVAVPISNYTLNSLWTFR